MRLVEAAASPVPLLESTPRTLYHGTLRKFLPDILRHGLEPNAGTFTRQMYDEEDPDDLRELVFAADKQGLIACFSAITSWIRIEYRTPYTVDLVRQHGALCVLKHAEGDFEHRDKDDGGWHDHPPQVEPNDYYSEGRVRVSHVLTGNKMLQFFAKHAGLRPETWRRPRA